MSITTTTKSDQECWTAFRQGDKQAFETLYKRYFSLLFDYGKRHTQEEDLTIDCLQDFFLYLWNHRLTLGDARSVKFYLLSSFRRRLFRLLDRERKHQYKRENFRFFHETEDLSVEARRILSEEESYRIKLIKTLMSKLPPRQKEIIHLRYFLNLSPREICDMTGLGYQTVVNHLCEGVKSLRKHKDYMGALNVA